MAEIYRALAPFAFTSKSGIPRVVAAGDLFSPDDPDFKGKEHLFEPVEAQVDRGRRVRAGDTTATETASAAPGERRARTRTRKTTEGQLSEPETSPKEGVSNG